MIDGQTGRTHFYISTQQTGVVCAVNVFPNDTLGVQGRRVRPQPDSFWSYYPGEVGLLNRKSTSWKPQHSQITRDNKDQMTALAKGLIRDDRQPILPEPNEIFSSHWHQRPSVNVHRPGTAKSGSIGSRPPTSTTDRRKMSSLSINDVSRPTTAPVTIETRTQRITTARMRPITANRPPPPPPPPRVPRVIESSGNFDNLTNSTFHHLAGGLKSSIFKGDNHFVHQICSSTNDSMIGQLNSSRESFLDMTNRTPPSEIIITKEQSIESELEETKNISSRDIINLHTGEDDITTEQIDDVPVKETSRENSTELEQPPIEQQQQQQQDDEDILQGEKDIDQYSFDLASDSSANIYDYKCPFSEEYEQTISLQSQVQTNNDSNFQTFYRDNKIKCEQNPNIKAVFEKCVKLARLQANTVKWEQRRRQNLITYNRLLKNATLDASASNLVGNLSTKNATNNNNDKEYRELNELKRDLRCNECKRTTCLGNCAPGQNYHLYKRIVSSIPSQSVSARQLSTLNGSNNRCKHGSTTCPISTCRNGMEMNNTNTMITNNRIRSSRTTFSYGQKNQQRSSVDLRPRSVRQVTRDVKMKYEQANLSPVVVVPLFEEESRMMLSKHSQHKSMNGLLPGKSFRSQRRDSLTMVSPQKMTS